MTPNGANKNDAAHRFRPRAFARVLAALAVVITGYAQPHAHAQSPSPNQPTIDAPKVEAETVADPGAGAPVSRQTRTQREVKAAFEKSGVFEGLDLDQIGAEGKQRVLKLPADRGEITFIRLSGDAGDDNTATGPQTASPPAVGPQTATPRDANETPEAPKPSPVAKVESQPLADAAGTPVDGSAQTPAESADSDGKGAADVAIEEEEFKGSYVFVYKLDELKLGRLARKGGRSGAVDLVFKDVVMLFSSKEQATRLSKLDIDAATSRYLRKFITTKRRALDLPAGGLIFARLSINENAYLDRLDKALDFKEREVQLQGKISYRMFRRLVGLKVAAAKPDVTPDDLRLTFGLEGFRPPKIGRYVDASDLALVIEPDPDGRLDMTGTAAARFGFGARKVKTRGMLDFDALSGDGEPPFRMTAKADEKALRNLKVAGVRPKEMDFLFSLDDQDVPKLRAEGYGEKDGVRVPIAGELDKEDGKELFKLEGNTLEAIAGLDIPGFDELKLPTVPKLNTGRAVVADTIVRGQPAKIVIGPIHNNDAAYVALSVDGGGIENLVPKGVLGDLGKVETGRAVYLYLPKGRAPPKIVDLPASFRPLFQEFFDADDLADAKPGLNLFQASDFADKHPFARLLSLFRSGAARAGGIRILGQVNPLVFDEPEDSAAETWGKGDGAKRLKRVLATLRLRGRVEGLEGVALGSLFRLADRAELAFEGSKSGKVSASLDFGGTLKLRGAKAARRFEFAARADTSGAFTWQGDEVDEQGEDIRGGQRVTLKGAIRDRRPADLGISLHGAFRLGDLFAGQVSGLDDLELQDVVLSRTVISASLGRGSARSGITIVDKPGTRFAVIDVSRGVRPASYLPGLTKTPLADLSLPETAVLIADDGTDPAAVDGLPPAMAKSLKATIAAAGIEIQPGISYLSRLRFDGSDLLGRLARRLGVPAKDAAFLSGRIPSSVVKAMAGGRMPKETAGLTLTAQLPRLTLPGLDGLFRLSDVTRLNFAPDADGAMSLALTTGGTFVLPIVGREEQVSLNARITGKGADRLATVDIAAGDANAPKLNLRAEAPLDFKDVKKAKNFTVTIDNGLTIADLLNTDVPGIGGLRLAEAKLSRDHVQGVLALGDTRFTVNLARLGGGGTSRLMTLEVSDLPGLSVIPGLDATPLADLRLDDLVLAYIPALPIPAGGGSGGLSPGNLPDPLRHLKDKFTLPAGGGGLVPGLNLASAVDPAKLGRMTDLLQKLGSGGGKPLKLRAVMPGEALAFLRDRLPGRKAGGKGSAGATVKALARSAIAEIINHTDLTIPVPAIKLPGIGQYLASREASIKIAGTGADGDAVPALTTAITGTFDFALPGTPTSGSLDHRISVTLDASRNLTAALSGTGRLNNVSGQLSLAGSLAATPRQADLALALEGEGLTLNNVLGLELPGVSEVALTKAAIRAGLVSAEITLRDAAFTATAFDFAKGRAPVLTLTAENLDAGRILPALAGTVLDAAAIERATFLHVPPGRKEALAGVAWPEGLAGRFDLDKVVEGFNADLSARPKQGGQLADILGGLGVQLSEPLDIEGRFAANPFAAAPKELLAAIDLQATLPKLSFNKFGSLAITFPDRPVLALKGSYSGLAARVETAVKFELARPKGDTIKFTGRGTFTGTPAKDGKRELVFAATAEDTGGRRALIEASLLLPGSPNEFRLKFRGEQTLSSLLGVDIPVIGDLNLSELERDPDYLVAKIRLKGLETTVGAFKTAGRWAVSFSAEGLKPDEFIPGLDASPLAGLTLPQAVFTYIPKQPGDSSGLRLPFDVAALPDKVRGAVGPILSPFGGGGAKFRPGLNLKSFLNPNDLPALKKLIGFTGGGGRPLKLTGVLPIEALKSLVPKRSGGGGISGEVKSALALLVKQVDLDTSLPAVNLPGVRDVMTFGDPHLRIRGVAANNTVALETEISGAMRLTLPGVSPVDMMGGLRLTAAKSGVGVALAAKGGGIELAGAVDLSKSDPRLQLAVTSEITVADLVGTSVPGIGDLALTDARIGSEIISGTVELKDARTTLALFDFKGGEKPFAALVFENVDAANFIPGVRETLLDNAKLERGALVYVPDGKREYPKNPLYSNGVNEALALVSRGGATGPTKGLRAGFTLRPKDGSPLASALEFVGLKDSPLEVSGALPSVVLGGDRGRVRSLSGDLLKQAVATVDLETRLPAVNLPGIKEVLVFGDPLFRIKGENITGQKGQPTGEVRLKVGMEGDLALKLPGRDLGFRGGIDIHKATGGKGFGLAVRSVTKVDWTGAFGLSFLTLKDVGLSGTIDAKEGGQAEFKAKLATKVNLGGGDDIGAASSFTLSSNAKPELRFVIEDRIDVAQLPVVGDLPGVNELSFANLWVGTSGLGGKVRIDKLGIGGEGTIFLHGGKPVAMIKADPFKVTDLVGNSGLAGKFKQVLEGAAQITLPKSVFAISTASLASASFGDLPAEAQSMVKDLLPKSGGDKRKLPFGAGVSLLAALSEADLPAAIREAATKNVNIFKAVDGPLLLGGGLKGVFDGNLEARLQARLPNFTLPANQPLSKLVSFDSVGAEGFLFIDVPKLQMGLGVNGNVTLDVPRLSDPSTKDKLKLQGDLYASFDAVSWAGSFKFAGNMQGDWHQPFGISKNHTFRNPAILIGFDSEGSVEFGVGASSIMTGLGPKQDRTVAADADFLININFSTSIPLPKKLAVALKAKGELSQWSSLESLEATFKGVVDGPMANEILKVLPDKKSRDALTYLKNELGRRSIFDVIQVDKLPLPTLSVVDPVIFFATPGAKLPGRDDTLDTVGIRVGGNAFMSLFGNKKRLGGGDVRLTLSDGLIVKGDLGDITLPPVLKIQNAKVDIVANIKQLPHFKVSGTADFLGAKDHVDIEFSKDRIHFEVEKDLGRLIKTKVIAATDSGDATGAREFIVEAETRTEIDDLIAKEIFPRMGIPKVVADAIKSQTPLFIHGAKFKGKLVEFLKGGDVTLEIDHSFFGTRMADPAVAKVKPVWASSNPLDVLPVPAIGAAMGASFFAYLKDHPVSLGKVNLGLVALEEASLSAESSGGSNRFKITGRVNAMGLPFSQSTAYIDSKTGLTLDSKSEINIGLPLGPAGKLARSETTLHYELNPAGLSHKINLKMSTSALGFTDHIYFDLDGDLSQTSAAFRSTHPCARFSSSSTLDAGGMRNLMLKMGQGRAGPADFIHAVNFKPEIKLPAPQDAVACGARVLELAHKAIDVAEKGLKEVANAANVMVGAVGNLGKEIIKGLKSLDCKLLRLGDCPRPSDCRGAERWNSTLKRCWVPGEVLLRHFSHAHHSKNWCADIRGAKDKWGQELIPWGCHGKWNQAWTLLSDGRLQNRKGACMGVDGYSTRKKVTLVPCDHWQVLRMEFTASGQVIAHRRDGSGGACLATDNGKMMLWQCERVGDKYTDLWLPYDPFKGKVVNPALEREAGQLEAAYKTPISNDPPVPFMRYWKWKTNEYYHTHDVSTVGRSGSGWSYEGKIGMIFAKRAPGTVPLFRFWRTASKGKNHVYTTNPNDFRGGQHGFNFDGVAGYVYNREIPNTVPLHRFHESANTNYVYAGDGADPARGKSGSWRRETVAAYMPMEVPPEIPAEEPSNPVPLAFNKTFMVFPKPAPGTMPLYLYGNLDNGNRQTPNILSGDFKEYGFGTPEIYFARVAGYVFREKRLGTLPIVVRRYGKNITLGYYPGPDFGPGKDARVVNAKPRPLLRYFNSGANDHLYTADPDQLGDGRDGYVRDGVAGSIYPGRVKGTVPLYRYWNGDKKDHVFTTNFQELWYGKDGYEYIGIEGYVYPKGGNGRLALHRYVNRGGNDNMLTTDFKELNGKNGAHGFSYVGIEGWVPQVVAPGAEARPGRAEGEMFLRYRNAATGDHKMARGFGDLGEGKDGYVIDRPLGMIFPTKVRDTVPLFRYFHAANKDTYYTNDFANLAWGRSGWVYRGIAGWVFDRQRPGTVALRLYHSSDNRDHMLAKDGEGKPGYVPQAIVGWIPAFRAPGANEPEATSKPRLLARYVNAGTGDWRPTAGLREFGDGSGGYAPHAYLGYIWPKRGAGMVPLYRYFNKTTNNTYVALDFTERWYGTGGYTFEGVLGYVYPAEQRGLTALHRYINDATGKTRTTARIDEMGGRRGRDGFRYQGVVGWVRPFTPPGLDQPEKVSQPLPLVRYRDARSGAYLATAGAVFGAGKGDLRIGRAQGRIFPTRAAGTVPLYEYGKDAGHVRRYTTRFDDFLFGRDGFRFKGIAGFVYPTARGGTAPLYRFDTREDGGHVLTKERGEFAGKSGYVGGVEIAHVPAYEETPSPAFRNLYLATNDNFSCLHAAAEPGADLDSALCSTNGDMRFTLWSDGTLRHDPKDLCLGVPTGGGGKDEVGVYTCDYSSGQQWEVRWTGGKPAKPDPAARARIVHKSTGRCLALADASARDEVEARLMKCAADADKTGPQSWALTQAVPRYVLPGTDAPVKASDPRLLVRYVNPRSKGADHRLVIGLDELGRGRDGFVPDVLLGRIYTTRARTDLVPLYRYVSAGGGDHMYTADFHELRFASGGYRFDGVLGYVSAGAAPGHLALHRYYNKAKSDHLVTARLDELDGASGRGGYRYEGIAGYTLETGAVVQSGWGKVYVANLGGMVCLTLGGDGGLESRRCADDGAQRLAFWSDGTLRGPGGAKCLSTDRAGKAQPEMTACDDGLTQRWTLEWAKGKAPQQPDGASPLRLAHWQSGACVTLADGSGRDGIAVVMAPCAKAANDDRRGTWWAHAKVPQFTAPGADAPRVNADPLPLIRYVNAKSPSGDHRLTVGPKTLGLGRDGYAMEQAQGYVWAGHAPDTAPVYQYRNKATGDHLWTQDFRELGWGAEGYDYQGVAGYLFADKRPGTVALHRYVNKAKGDHLLTADFEEFAGKAGRSGYAYAGIAAWAPRYPEAPRDGFAGLYLATNKNLSCLDGIARVGGRVTSSFCHDHEQPKFSFWQDGTMRFDAQPKDGTQLCLDTEGAGGAVILARCAYTRAQQFALRWQGASAQAADPQKVVQIVHQESGRCLGLADASGQDGVQAVLQPCTAPGGTVQGWSAGTARPAFTAPGMEVAEKASDRLPFIRYVNSRTGDHSMQAGPEPLGLGGDGYEMQTAQGFIFTDRSPGTLPLYRYRDGKTGDTIYTRDFHEFRFNKGTVRYDGWVGYVYGAAGKGAVALHRYVNKAKGDHLLTAHPDRMGAGSGTAGYVADGVVAWVPPYDETPDPAHQAVFAATNGNLTCLDADGSDGGLLLSSYCGRENGKHRITRWKDGTLRQDASGLCLSLPVPDKGGRAGAAVTLARCDYTRAQQWQVGKPGAQGARRISHTDSGKCLGIADGSGQDGVETRAYPCGKPSRGPDLQAFVLSTGVPEFVAPGADAAVAKAPSVPLVRYARARAHLLKLGPEEWETGQDGYRIEVPQGTIHPTRAATGMVPLYRYRHGKRDQMLYVTDFLDYRYAKNGYALDGILGYVQGRKAQDTVALRRYRHDLSGDDVLTVDPDEFGGDQGGGGYAFMGIQGWVSPYQPSPIRSVAGAVGVTKDWFCLGAAETAGGTKAAINACAHDKVARFTLFDDDSFRQDASGLCLTFEDDRQPAVWAECVYRDPRQRMRLQGGGTSAPQGADGKRAQRLGHVTSGLCATLQQGRAVDGNGLVLSACAGQGNGEGQEWRWLAALPKAKVLKNWRSLSLAGGGGLCVHEQSKRRDRQVALKPCPGGKRRQGFARFDDGTIRHERSGACLSLPVDAASGQAAILAPCLVNSPTQRFELLWNGAGRAPKGPDANREFRLRHAASGRCLRARGGIWTEGNPVILGTCAKRAGAPDQNWRLEGKGIQ